MDDCRGLERARMPSLKTSPLKRFAIVGVLCVAVLGIGGMHSFLVMNQPADAEILVVEGWVPEYALRSAALEFNKGGYSLLVTTGGPSEKDCPGCSTSAATSARRIVKLGVKEANVIPVPAPYVAFDRTLTSAQAFKKFLDGSDMRLSKGVNILTVGPHARKTYTVYRKVLPPGVHIGMISVPTDDYDPRFWWASPAGIKWVSRDMAGYLYALLFYW